MTDDDFRQLASCFARYLMPYRRYVGEIRCAYNVENYCRGLLSDEPRKSIEPLALRCGVAVRSLQCFLKDGEWDHLAMRDHHQRTAAEALVTEPDPDDPGTIGLIDETRPPACNGSTSAASAKSTTASSPSTWLRLEAT